MLNLAAVLAALLLGFAAPASAAVEISFYSKELGSRFPHAFVTLHGTLERSGERVDGDYGFTAKGLSPAILFGPVTGEMMTHHGEAYIAGSDRHFSLTLSDEDYGRVLATVERWRTLKQPSYSLERRNCVHFVADIAASLGMRTDIKGMAKKPRSFLEALTAANGAWLVAHDAHLYTRKGAAPSSKESSKEGRGGRGRD